MNTALIYENLEYQNETAMLLADAGFIVNISISSDFSWFEAIKKEKPDILVISVSRPDLRLLEQLNNFKGQIICPVIVLANEVGVKDKVRNVIEKVIISGADSCITGDISVERITNLIQINLARFKVSRGRNKEIQVLNKNIEYLETCLRDRKDIDRAKGILMTTYKMDEDEAYSALRRLAMDTGNKLGEVSRNLISESKL